MFKIIVKKFLFSLFYVGFFVLVVFLTSNTVISLTDKLGAYGYIILFFITFLVAYINYNIRKNQKEKKAEYLSEFAGEKKFILGAQIGSILKSKDYIAELTVCGIWLIPLTIYALSITETTASPIFAALMFFALLELVYAFVDICIWLCVRKNWFKKIK